MVSEYQPKHRILNFITHKLPQSAALNSMKKLLFLLLNSLLLTAPLSAQQFVQVIGFDFFQRNTNPNHTTQTTGGQTVGQDANKRNSGMAYGSVSIGVRMMPENQSDRMVVGEAHLNLSPLAFDLHQFKGIGAVSAPIMGKIIWGSKSGIRFFEDRLNFGLGVGAGIQPTKTEILFMPSRFKNEFLDGGVRNPEYVRRPVYVPFLLELSYVTKNDAPRQFTGFMRFGAGRKQAATFSVGFNINRP